MAKLIAKVYGDALFELATEEGKAAELLEEFSVVREVFSTNLEFNRLMNHPKLTKEEKVEVLANVFKGQVSNKMTGFLELLMVKDRFNELEAIYDYFTGIIKKHLGIGVAHVTTATSLDEIQKTHIKERLLEVTEYKEMEMEFAVDASLIGGMVIRIGDRVMDSSIANNLNRLKRQLVQNQI
jgi:F-type H+-transporting ATPase subunit delta